MNSIKLIICFLIISFFSSCISSNKQPWEKHGALATQGHYIVYEDGTPFFYLGDTNWEYIMRARREDATKFLQNRSDKGFTVLQAIITGAYLKVEPVLKGDSAKANIYGDQPFIDYDITKPKITPGDNPENAEEYDFWDHLDFLVQEAGKYGIYMGILPGWHKLYTEKVITENNAYTYGLWLGKRYKDFPNIIWILGGDTRPKTDEAVNTFHEMAKGIREGDEGNHLISFHPMGGSRSAQWFQESEWLDFNMYQSGHSARDLPNYKRIAELYELTPVKPCLDAEPRYEDHSVNWNPDNGWFNDFDVRQAAYWSLFAGACGHTYGTRGVWQMYAPDAPKRGPLNHYWYDAMDLPGGQDMKHVKDLMVSRPILNRIPDQAMIVDSVYSGADHIRATRGEGYAFIYIPTGKPFKIDIDKISTSDELAAWWYNPRDGKCYDEKGIISATPFKKLNTSEKIYEFNPPGKPERGNDWVLVLDNSSLNYAAPGSVCLIN